MNRLLLTYKLKNPTYLFALWLLFFAIGANAQITKRQDSKPENAFVHKGAGNPYLPLWEHLPDGEPRVFEDPDKPGKFRAYIIGSHDLRFTSYCGPDIRMWSAPVEDLSSWRDEGPDIYLCSGWQVGCNVCAGFGRSKKKRRYKGILPVSAQSWT